MLKKQIIDQAAHFLLAAAILLPAAISPSMLTFGIAGFGCGLVREATEKDPILSGGSMLDILFWTLGGMSVGFFCTGVLH